MIIGWLVIYFLLFSADEKEVKNKLKKTIEEIKSTKEELKKLKKRKSKVLKEIKKIQKTLNKSRKRLKKLKEKEEKLTKEIKNLKKKNQEMQQKMSYMKDFIKNKTKFMYKYSLSSPPSFFNPYSSYIFLCMGKSLQTDFKNYTSLYTSYSTLLSVTQQKVSSLTHLSSLKHKEKLKCRRGLLYSSKKERLLKIIKKREEERLNKIKALQKRRKQLETLIAKLVSRKKHVKSKLQSIIRPTEGPIIRGFGEVKDKKVGTKLLNKGIDIKAKFKANVYAIQKGEVVYEGEFLGYGKIIIINHKNGFSSVYAHLEETLVTTGDKVEKGEVIGKVGKDSLTGETILHFELRKNGIAVNPLEYFK